MFSKYYNLRKLWLKRVSVSVACDTCIHESGFGVMDWDTDMQWWWTVCAWTKAEPTKTSCKSAQY